MKLRLLTCIALAGCASTGVVPIGQDTFMVAKQSGTGFHSGATVTADLYREASAYCAEHGKELMPVNLTERDGQPGYAFANSKLEFRCLDKGDPQLGRPTMRFQ